MRIWPRRITSQVQGKFSAKALYDVTQNQRIVSERVGLERGHDTPRPEIVDPDRGFADSNYATFPFAFIQTGNVACHNIGTQSTPVTTELRDGVVRRDEKRKHPFVLSSPLSPA
jgi:hypothetical protein